MVEFTKEVRQFLIFVKIFLGNDLIAIGREAWIRCESVY